MEAVAGEQAVSLINRKAGSFREICCLLPVLGVRPSGLGYRGWQSCSPCLHSITLSICSQG